VALYSVAHKDTVAVGRYSFTMTKDQTYVFCYNLATERVALSTYVRCHWL